MEKTQQKPSAKKSPQPSNGAVGLSKHQTFAMERMLRSEIYEHPSNPRQIGEAARKKLKGKMKDVGLMQPLIVNQRTGYLLGGHQRLAALDSLEHYKNDGLPVNDYAIDVAIVDVDEKTEREMLVFLNNPSSQGTWDLDALSDMVLDAGSSFEGMGFERVDIEMLFDGDARFDTLFGDNDATGKAKDALKQMKQDGREANKDKKTGLDEFREKGASRDVSADYYVVVVCKDQAEKEALMRHINLPKGEQYISSREILAMKKA